MISSPHNFPSFCTQNMASSEAMTSSIHTFAFILMFPEMFGENLRNFKTSLYLFSLFCSKFFTFSSEIKCKLNLCRISPLKFSGVSHLVESTFAFLDLPFPEGLSSVPVRFIFQEARAASNAAPICKFKANR